MAQQNVLLGGLGRGAGGSLQLLPTLRTVAQVRQSGRDATDRIEQQNREIAKSHKLGFTAEEMAELELLQKELEDQEAEMARHKVILDNQGRATALVEEITAKEKSSQGASDLISESTKTAWVKLLERSLDKDPGFLKSVVEELQTRGQDFLGSQTASLVAERAETPSDFNPEHYEYEVAIDGLNYQISDLRQSLEVSEKALERESRLHKSLQLDKVEYERRTTEELQRVRTGASIVSQMGETLKAEVDQLEEQLARREQKLVDYEAAAGKASNDLEEAQAQIDKAAFDVDALEKSMADLQAVNTDTASRLEATERNRAKLAHESRRIDEHRGRVEEALQRSRAVTKILLQVISSAVLQDHVVNTILDGDDELVILPGVPEPGRYWRIYYDALHPVVDSQRAFLQLALELITQTWDPSSRAKNFLATLVAIRDELLGGLSRIIASVLEMLSVALGGLVEKLYHQNIHFPGWLILSQVVGLIDQARPSKWSTAALSSLDVRLDQLDPIVASLSKLARAPGRLDQHLAAPWNSANFDGQRVTLIGCRRVRPGLLVMEHDGQKIIWVPQEGIGCRSSVFSPITITRRSGEVLTLDVYDSGATFALYNIPRV